MYMFVRLCTMYAYVEFVLSQNQSTAAARRQQEQYNDSGVPSSCFCASRSQCMCVVAQQEIEPRQRFHAQRSNLTHTSSDLSDFNTRYTKHTAVAKTVAHTCHWDVNVRPFQRNRSPGYQVFEVNPILPKGNIVCIIIYITSA